ncbi:MAG: ABC transporter ATP-binding protein [Deltaproteobacteria bacterium]|nr:ABC transporter ATP-binding protein [Deltaproteobacteria bacterium]
MTTPVLTLSGVTKRVGRPPRVLFDGLSFTVAAGETVAVRGRSGCGKTTLLNLAGGLDLAFDGSVLVDGRDVRALGDTERSAMRRTVVGMVFQAFHLVEHLTLLGNVLLPARFCSAAERAGTPARARALLTEVGLGDRADATPAGLSGGERQRVASARALLMQPRLVLADEPTGNLDRATADGVLDVLARLVLEAGSAVMVVTHDPAVAARATRRLLLADGGVTEEAA